MKQAALSIILAFILSVGIASCSHRPIVPFLERLGINTDSVLFDSLPNNFYSDSIGNVLTREQCDSLNTFYYKTKIVSIKQFGENYLLTFVAKCIGMFSILYDKDGKVLDQCRQMGYNWGSKEYKDSTFIQKSIDKINGIKKAQGIPPGCVSFIDFTWERHFVDNNKFEVTGRIQNTDSIIKYLYEVSNNKITQIKKTVTNGMNTAEIDVISLPVSQAYLACDLMNKNPKEPYSPPDMDIDWTLSALFYELELEPYIYYNTPTVLKWIADHRENNKYLFKCLDIYNTFSIFYGEKHHENYRKTLPKDFITKQIKQMKDKDARNYILKLFADEDAEREAFLKK